MIAERYRSITERRRRRAPLGGPASDLPQCPQGISTPFRSLPVCAVSTWARNFGELPQGYRGPLPLRRIVESDESDLSTNGEGHADLTPGE
jgi:hypothetical protein